MKLILNLLLIMFAMPSLFARLKKEVWVDPDQVTFLSDEDFQMASLMSFDEFPEVSTPYEDPEAQQTYYEGDMMIKEDDEKKVAMFMAKRWPKGTIPYIMEDKFSQEERAAIARGIMTLQENTCIKFVPKEDHDSDYVWMRRGPGCAAHVGRIGGQQWLFLGQGCFGLETVVHELMHSVGFIHEQSRPDRDEYVKIKWENIKEGAKRNFRKHTTDYLADHGFAYDLMSVMHYRMYAFSKNKKPTIIPKKPIAYLRCRGLECPSDLDVKKINYLYQCKDGKSEFLGANHIGEKYSGYSKKKGRDSYTDLENNFLIGDKFYESMPTVPRQPPTDDEEDSEYDSSDYEYASPVGPCVGDNCYQAYDSDIDSHMPYETQQMPSILPLEAQKNNQQNSQRTGGFTSWLTNLFHW